MAEAMVKIASKWMSGIRGRCCNPSYWEDQIGGWPVDMGLAWNGLQRVCTTTGVQPGVVWTHRSLRGQTQFKSSETCFKSRHRVRFSTAKVLGFDLSFVYIPGVARVFNLWLLYLVGGVTINVISGCEAKCQLGRPTIYLRRASM